MLTLLLATVITQTILEDYETLVESRFRPEYFTRNRNIEEYIFSYINTHVDKIQTSIPIKRKVVKILDFLISKGSTMGFLLKEELI